MRRTLSLLALSGLSACAAVQHAPPAPRPTPEAWTEAAVDAVDAVDDRWWLAYGDPVLAELVEAAGQVDEVAIAETRLREARAGLRQARAALAPEISGGATGSSRRNGDGLPLDLGSGSAQTLTNARNAAASASAAWDADLFGANRARARASRASARAAAFDVEDVRIQARFTAAQLYISYRDAQARLSAAERTVEALREALALASARSDAGLVSNLDVAQARAALSSAVAQPAAARQAAAEARLALEALLGRPPGALRETLIAGDRAVPVANLPDRLLAPVAVIARRPDLLAAEQRLTAAGFDRKAAVRDFFPRLTFSGLVGVQWADPETPFTAGGGIYNVAGSLAAPLLTFGRLEGALQGADARKQRAALEYRDAATEALSEVERALIASIEAQVQAGAQADALAAARDQAALARSRYVAGLAPFLEVLVAEQSAFASEAAAARAQADAAQAFARLSSAMGLGGGA